MRVEIIGRSEAPEAYPYEVGICFDDPAHPIMMGDGSGRDSFGGTLALQRLRDPRYLQHLERCHCAWLVHLAEEEDQRGHRFSPGEIFSRWRQHC